MSNTGSYAYQLSTAIINSNTFKNSQATFD